MREYLYVGTSTLLLFILKWPITKIEKRLKISQEHWMESIYANISLKVDDIVGFSLDFLHFFWIFGKEMSESGFRVKLEEREFWKDLKSSGVLECRNRTFDI